MKILHFLKCDVFRDQWRFCRNGTLPQGWRISPPMSQVYFPLPPQWHDVNGRLPLSFKWGIFAFGSPHPPANAAILWFPSAMETTWQIFSAPAHFLWAVRLKSPAPNCTPQPVAPTAPAVFKWPASQASALLRDIPTPFPKLGTWILHNPDQRAFFRRTLIQWQRHHASLSAGTKAKVAGKICWLDERVPGLLSPDFWFTNVDIHAVLDHILNTSPSLPKLGRLVGWSLTDVPETRSSPTTWYGRSSITSYNPITSKVLSPTRTFLCCNALPQSARCCLRHSLPEYHPEFSPPPQLRCASFWMLYPSPADFLHTL